MSLLNPGQAPNSSTSQADRPLLSESTILILSGFLIGSVMRNFVEQRLEHNVLVAGMVGLVAYVALAYGSYYRKRRQQKIALKRASADLEKRFERHIVEGSSSTDLRQSPAPKSIKQDQNDRAEAGYASVGAGPLGQ